MSRNVKGSRGNCAVCGKPIGPGGYRGWCKPHYWRWRRYGDPRGGSPVRQSWTAEQDAYLRDFYAATDTLTLARRLGCTPRAIHRRVQALGIGKADAAGWDPSEVAGMLGVHRTSVLHWIAWGRLKARRVGRWWRVSDAALREFAASEWGAQRLHADLIPDPKFLQEIIGMERAA